MDINPNDIFLALFCIMFGASHAGSASAMGPDIGKAGGAAKRVFKIMEYPSQIDAVGEDGANKIRLNLDQVKGKIEFRNVWFRYPTRKEDFVHRGLNLIINPGESVALVGESGCGKSTFVNLMMRFYEVDDGEILLDDVNIKTINLHDLRRAISLVMQEPIIFNYSVLENILYGDLTASNERVLGAAELANVLEFINNKDIYEVEETAQGLINQMQSNQEAIVAIIGQEKYDEELDLLTKIKEQEAKMGNFHAIAGDVDRRTAEQRGEVPLSPNFEQQCGIKGGKLSGGQKQRVAIARTIIRQPKVLLLDEATSALDEDSQKKVQSALDHAMAGRTTIIIAHRLSTIEKCDKIFVLENGRVIEEGKFAALKSSGGYFSNMSKGKAKK